MDFQRYLQKRLKKVLLGDAISINMMTTLIIRSVCAEEGLSLCNEIKLNQQIKRYHLNKKQQLGELCEKFAIDMPESSRKSNKHKGQEIIKKILIGNTRKRNA